MFKKKQVKNFLKKSIVSFVALVMALGTSASPILAATAPTVSSVVVSETSIQVVYTQDVVDTLILTDDNYTKSASNFDKYTFKIDGTDYPLSRSAPYSNYTEYFNTTTAADDGVLNIFGLNLTQGASWELDISGIATDTSSYPLMDDYFSGTGGTVSTSTDPVIYKIENTTGASNGCYGYPCGKAEEQITITGIRFNIEASGIDVEGFGTTQTVTTSTADAFTMTIPGGATTGNREIKIKNLNDNAYSNVKSFAVYDTMECGVIKGVLTSSVATDINDVPVRLEAWNTQYGSAKSHSNGRYAITAYNSGCVLGSYDVFFTTKAGSNKAAPTEIGSKTAIIDTATDAGPKAFATANLTGTVTDSSNTPIPVNGATVVVHNSSWSTAQNAITDANGNYKVYIPVSDPSNYYGVEVQPPTYNPGDSPLQTTEEWVTISQNATNSVKNISLPSLNVQGTLKTPTTSTGNATTANPSPNTIVPNASITIHNQDWSVAQWATTDSDGVFQFGVPAGSNYILEVQPPYGDDSFGGYSGKSYQGLTIGESLTNLDDPDGQISTGPRLAVPNVFGRIYADTNSSGTYTEGEQVADAWVSMWGPGFWAGMNTNSEGKFSFAVSDAGNYEINIDAPSSDYSNYKANVSVTSAQISTGRDLGDVAFPTPNITGTIYGPALSVDADNGQANINVDVCPFMSPGQCYWGQTDSDGAFGIGTVPEGTWEMRFNMWGSSDYAVPSTKILVVDSNGVMTTFDSDTNDADIPLLANGALKILLVDPSIAGLTGVVYGPTGTAGQQANLSLRQNTMTMMDMSEWTNANNDGEFVFGTVGAGTYELEVMPNWNSTFSRAMYTITVAEDGTVSSSDTGFTFNSKRNITVRLTQPNITGTLKTPVYVPETHSGLGIDSGDFDDPVAWGWVSMHTQGPMMGPGGWYGGNTSETGAFSFGGVQAGTYTIEYQAGWGSKFSTVTETIVISEAVAAGTASLNLNTVSTKADAGAIRVGLPQLRGTVVKADGTTPVQNAWIMVFDQSNWNFQPQGANTDSNGQFSLGGLSDGTYDIEVNMPWGEGLIAPSGLSVVVANDVGVVKQIVDGVNSALSNNTIRLITPSKTISGRVYKDSDSDGEYDAGEEVDNARVEVHKDMGGGFVETTTSSTGIYSLTVGGGSWWVEVRPDWGSDVDWTYNEMPTRVTFANDSVTETEEKNFIVSATNATIYGYVKKADGTAVSNCWVDICQDMGMCNGRSTDSNGRFSIKASAGTYRVSAFPSHDLMNTFGAPDEKMITVAANQSADAGILTLKAKNSSITGKVQDTAGNAVSNVVINVFQFNAPGWGMSFTDTNGAFDVTVASGTWGVMVMPMSNDYVYQGAPLSVTVADSETSSDNNFILQTADSTIKGKVRLNSATGYIVTDLWGGVWIKNNDSTDTDNFNNMLDFGGPMDDMMSKSGMMDVDTGGGSPMGGGMEKGGGTGINNGAFELKVPSGEYEIGLGTPPGSSYTLLSTETVTIVSDTDSSNSLGYTEVNLIVIENDATISGHFYIDANDNGVYDADNNEEVSGMRAMVNADKNGGGWQMTESDSNGAYSLGVSAGTWRVDAFVDVFMTFGFGASAKQYMVISPDEKITIASGGTTTLNFEVKSLDATIAGTVTDDTNAGMSGVWVFANYGTAEMVEEFKGPGGPGIGAFTDASGNYSIKVTAGDYKIGVGVPPWDTRGLITPNLISVTAVSGETNSDNDMQFKASNATIAGNVFLDADGDNTFDESEAKASFVRVWSDAGQGNGIASTDGSYSVNVTNGDTWYLVAVAEIENTLYESAKATIVVNEVAETQNLELISLGITIPESKTVSFDSSESKTITLTNGLKLEMPAASIATSGTVTVSITPTVDVKPDSKEKPIGITYDFSARDADGKEISSLAGNVTISMPYDEALIEAAGYSEESITPKYFNETTGTWENYDTVMRDTENNVLIIITDHFSAGGPVGEEVATAPTGLSASVVSSSSISLSWTDASDDETGFKVYRNSADSSWESVSAFPITSAGATSYTDTGLTASTTYYYRVKASNANGDSSWSNTASATTSATVSTSTGGAVPLSFLTPATTDETTTTDDEIMTTDEDATTDETTTATDETTTEIGTTTIEQAIQGLIMSQKSVSNMTVDELKADIATIGIIIAQLQVELNKLVSVVEVEGCSIIVFDRNLKKGITGEDVKCLQIILNSDATTQLADSGIGSAGNETTYFGSLTKSAVIKFQEKYSSEILASWNLTTGTGFVGSTTIEKLNSLLGK